MEQSGTSREAESTETVDLLQKLKTEVYNDSNEDLALGLGRPVEEIEAWIDGSEEIDEDAQFKIKRLADERVGGDTSGPESANDPDKNTEQRI